MSQDDDRGVSREAVAARNRARFPESARFVDDLRAVFGPGVRLVYASENGNTIGEPGPQGVTPVLERKRDAV